jgi:hypothetical protein
MPTLEYYFSCHGMSAEARHDAQIYFSGLCANYPRYAAISIMAEVINDYRDLEDD